MNQRLEYLRKQIQAERISTDEILELSSMADQIEPGDVELLQWAGVPENMGAVLDDCEHAVRDAVLDSLRCVEVTSGDSKHRLGWADHDLVDLFAALDRMTKRMLWRDIKGQGPPPDGERGYDATR